MSRFFTQHITPEGVYIRGEDCKHILSVLRMQAGDTLTLCDGQGHESEGVILSLSKEQVLVKAGPWAPSLSEPLHRITLFQGLPKTGKMETIIQKCTELGLYALVPLLTKRCVALPGKDYDKKRERYQKVAEAAAKQSGRGIIPRICPLVSMDKMDLSSFDLVLIAYEGERELTLKQAIQKQEGQNVALIIGPEGGFEESEVAAAVQKGALCVSLGHRILRTETAGMAMLAQLLFAWE